MSAQQLLYQIKVQDTGMEDATQRAAALKFQLDQLRESNKLLQTRNKELADSNQKSSKEYQDNTRKIVENQAQIKSLNSEYNRQINTMKSVIGSYERLDAETKQLIADSKKLDQSNKEQREEYEKLSKQINENTDKLKKMDAAQGSHQRNVGNYKSALSGLGDTISTVAGTFGIALGVEAVVGFGKASVEAFAEAQKGDQQLLFALGNNKKAFEDLDATAQQMMSRLSVDDDDIKKLYSYGAAQGLTSDQIKKTTQAAYDLAAATGMDVDTAMKTLTATYEGNIGKLGKLDGSLTGLTQKQLESGDAVDILAKKYSGFAENAANTTEGKMRGVAVFFGNLKESVGGALVGAFDKIVSSVTDAFHSFSGLFDAIGIGGGKVDGFKLITIGLGKVIELISLPIKTAIKSVTTLVDAYQVGINEGKKLLNFFGGHFQVDQSLSFKKVGDDLKSMGNDYVDFFTKVQESEKQTTDTQKNEGEKKQGQNKKDLAAQKKYQDERKRALEELFKDESDASRTALDKSLADQLTKGEEEIRHINDLEKRKIITHEEAVKARQNTEKKNAEIISDIQDRLDKSENDKIAANKKKQQEEQTAALENNLKQIRNGHTEELAALVKSYNDKKITKEKYESELKRISIDSVKGQIAEIEKALYPETADASKNPILPNITDEQRQDLISKLKTLYEQMGDLSENKGKEVAGKLTKQIQYGLDQLSQGLQLFSQYENQQAEQESKSLDRQQKAELAQKGLTAEQKTDIEAKYQQKREEMERAAFDRRKREAIAQAVIDTASGVMSVLSTGGGTHYADLGISAGILAAFVGAMGLAKIGVIASQKYAEGGLLDGPSHADGGIQLFGQGGSYFGEAEGGEAIMTRKATQMFLPQLSIMNQAGGGKPLIPSRYMAQGGITTVPSMPMSPQIDYSVLAGMIGKEVAMQVNQIQPVLVADHVTQKQRSVAVAESNGRI